MIHSATPLSRSYVFYRLRCLFFPGRSERQLQCLSEGFYELHQPLTVHQEAHSQGLPKIAALGPQERRPVGQNNSVRRYSFYGPSSPAHVNNFLSRERRTPYARHAMHSYLAAQTELSPLKTNTVSRQPSSHALLSRQPHF